MSNLDEMKIEYAGRSTGSDTYAKYFTSNYEMNGSPKGYDLERLVSDPQEIIKDIISLAKYYYHKNGLIMRTINIIRDFGIGDIEANYPTKNKKVKKVIEEFNERIDIHSVLKDVLFELALTGNCAGYNRSGKRIDVYPITQVEVSPLIKNNKPVLVYLNEGLEDVVDIEGLEKYLESAYPEEIAKGIKGNKDKIVLDSDKTFFLKMNSSRYEPYGVTFLLPAFDELAHKTMLKETEKSTATAIIEKILRIGVGDKDHPPTQQEIDFYSNLMTGKKGSLKITVPYFVDAKWIEPDSSVFGVEKYEQVDKDLLSALGVTLTLIRGGGGGNYSDGLISIAGLIKTIESMREGLPRIITDWYKQELVRNGLGEHLAPVVTLSKVEIDNSARIELVQWLFQTAGLPYEVLYDEFGYDYTHIKLVREQENEEAVEEVFKLRAMPFQGNQGDGEAGRPELKSTERETDESTSNNDQPRTGREDIVK